MTATATEWRRLLAVSPPPYLVDANNHTNYAQVVEELVSGSVTRQYTYGHDLISQRQLIAGDWKLSFYGYDGHGRVRYLTNETGAITDTYTYDAFGKLIAQTGTTPNEYLYAGEQFDANIGFYYLRARYFNNDTGRFITSDPFFGNTFEPMSLHKYLYAHANPIDNVDPTGLFSISAAFSAAISGIINALSALRVLILFQAIRLSLVAAGGVSFLLTRGQGFLRLIQGTGQKGVEAMQNAMLRSNRVITFAEAQSAAAWRNYEHLRTTLNQALTAGSRNLANIQWHHIVEQGHTNAIRFGNAVNNLANVVPTPAHIHTRITTFYNTTRAVPPQIRNLGFRNVRAWMQAQDWETQYQAGLEIWKQAMRGGPITWVP